MSRSGTKYLCQEAVLRNPNKKLYQGPVSRRGTKDLYQEVAARAADLQGTRELADSALQVASVSLSAVQLLQALLQRLASCLQLTLQQHHTSLFHL
jgi:hypothetical protein